MSTKELHLAVVHKVIFELNDVGKTRLQKLGYFLQESFQVPTKYAFRMHHYGPYSEALDTDMARLQLTGYVAIRPGLAGLRFSYLFNRQCRDGMGGIGSRTRTANWKRVRNSWRMVDLKVRAGRHNTLCRQSLTK